MQAGNTTSLFLKPFAKNTSFTPNNPPLTSHLSPLTSIKSTLHIGRLGESIAAEYLQQKGYRIAALNFRAGRGEIDIIAWAHDRLLVFVEVKTRSGEGFGGPEGAVDARKQDLLARTAGIYMDQIDYDWEIRFDIVAVLMKNDQVLEIRHVEDAFFPEL
ncbi:MAG: YraN family protein [Bacteroidetes bacterium]|nr:YraN family protein [Bacteroidota bacterium]